MIDSYSTQWLEKKALEASPLSLLSTNRVTLCISYSAVKQNFPSGILATRPTQEARSPHFAHAQNAGGEGGVYVPVPTSKSSEVGSWDLKPRVELEKRARLVTRSFHRLLSL